MTVTRRGRIIFTLGGFLLVLGGILLGGYLYLRSIGVYGGSDPGRLVRFEIPRGSSSGEIGEILEQHDVIPSTLGWRIVTFFDNRVGDVQAGEYEIHSGLTPRDALDELIDKGPAGEAFVSITFPEGLWLTEMAERLAEETDLSEEKFLTLVTEGRIDSSLRPRDVETMEGLLFPSTYQVAESDTEETVAQRLADEMVNRFARLDVSAARSLGMSDYELIIIASMIEAETRVDDERPMVARVIYNRLEQGMTLGIDATFQYALGERKQELTAEDLAIDSPYNLRQNTGLPPTPIGAPGAASLEAAAQPAEGAWLYYVLADCEGNHAFSETNEEFLADKAAYQALDC
ncbi:MAG: endolytic transglycosylase MltG [Actinomycetota bacterium]